MVDHCREKEELDWLADVIVALACTGLRIAELADLRWSDVDLAQRIVSLTDESGLVGGSDVARRTLKSGRSRRIPLHDQLFEILRGRTAQRASVFQGPRGGKLKPDTVRNVLIRDVLTPLAPQFQLSPAY
jgi:integrase